MTPRAPPAQAIACRPFPPCPIPPHSPSHALRACCLELRLGTRPCFSRINGAENVRKPHLVSRTCPLRLPPGISPFIPNEPFHQDAQRWHYPPAPTPPRSLWYIHPSLQVYLGLGGSFNQDARQSQGRNRPLRVPPTHPPTGFTSPPSPRYIYHALPSRSGISGIP